jgi:hypothetical protein
MNELTPLVARRIIDRVGGPGQPPEYGFQYFTAGLDEYLSVIEEEYFSTLIRQGGSSFKMVVGVYGGGKTHFLYCVRDLAWKYEFVTVNVDLSPNSTPFSKLDLVYKDIAKNIVPPLKAEELLSGYERGIDSFIRRWFIEKMQGHLKRGLSEEEANKELEHEINSLAGVESISFVNAFRCAVLALMNKRDNDFIIISQWLRGEGYPNEVKKFNILQKIDKTTAFEMIRSLSQLIRELGYSGLIISFDEAELQSSMSTREKSSLMSNMREIIDECARNTFQGVMIFYAVPDENFLQGRTMIYEALKQRLQTVIDDINPSGVKIELERVIPDPENFLEEVGKKLAKVYEIAYGYNFEDLQVVEDTIKLVTEIALKDRYADIGYKRTFVQKFILGLNFLRKRKSIPTESNLGSA